MGEAKRKRRQVIEPPKFQERVVTLNDETGALVVCLLTITGAVYILRKGERVRDSAIIDLVHKAARRESVSSDLIKLL